MQSSDYWKAVLVDRENFLERILKLLRTSGVRYCIVGGTGVNAYTYPVVTEDLDIAVAAAGINTLQAALGREFKVRRSAHSINVSAPESKLQVQIQTDPGYFDFVERAEIRNVMDFQLPVAQLEDLLRGKIWAASDTTRRKSKRQKDLADIARIIEVAPELRAQLPDELLSKLV